MWIPPLCDSRGLCASYSLPRGWSDPFFNPAGWKVPYRSAQFPCCHPISTNMKGLGVEEWIFPEARCFSPLWKIWATRPQRSPKWDLSPQSEELPGQCTKCYSQMLQEANSLKTALLAGLKQSFLFSQGPLPTFVKTLYTLSVSAQAHILKFLKPSLENVKGRYTQVYSHDS